LQVVERIEERTVSTAQLQGLFIRYKADPPALLDSISPNTPHLAPLFALALVHILLGIHISYFSSEICCAFHIRSLCTHFSLRICSPFIHSLHIRSLILYSFSVFIHFLRICYLFYYSLPLSLSFPFPFLDKQQDLDQFIETSKTEWATEETRSSIARKEKDTPVIASVGLPVLQKQIRN
jgi:hypothetical protein